MSGNQFIPKFESSQSQDREPFLKTDDKITKFLVRFAKYLVILLFVSIPLFFTPGLWASLGFDKVLSTLVVATLVVFLLCFLALRSRQVKTVVPVSLGLFWLVVLTSLFSGLLSGDTLDALRGSGLEVHTTAFLAVIGLVMTVSLVLQNSKNMTMKSLVVFTGSVTLVLLYSLLRIIFGADFLPLGSFASVAISPVGSLNDLGILSGMMVVFGLITMILLPIKSVFKSLLSLIVLLALIMLAVTNLYVVWLVVGFFGLFVLVFAVTQDSLFKSGEEASRSDNSRFLIFTTAIVCVVSAIFVFMGEYANTAVNKVISVSYTEVRPSTEGTIGVLKAVYEENLWLGNGPNRFADAWRLHKDQRINETIFWDTDFETGSSFMLTQFVNLGLIGGGLFVLFHVWFLYLGYKLLLRSVVKDHYWYYVGAVSFASAGFLWGMSYVYGVGVTILLLAALFTGLTFVSAYILLPNMTKTVGLITNRPRGFFIMTLAIVVIPVFTLMIVSVSNQYLAQTKFTRAQVTAKDLIEFRKAVSSSFALYPDDRFMSTLAQVQIKQLNQLLSIVEPTEEDQQRFLNTVESVQSSVDKALSQDRTNPDNHSVLAGMYSNLAVAGISGAKERTLLAIEESKKLDPQNPGYYLMIAQMATHIGDIELARSETAKSLVLKDNYLEALFLSVQLDIREGDTVSAIATAKSIITLEPNNPTRYFQLGVLLASADRHQEAIVALETAVKFDVQFANARYMLALSYLTKDRQADALEQLKFVARFNQDNRELQTLIQQIESGDVEEIPDIGIEVPVNEIDLIQGGVDTEPGNFTESLAVPIETKPEELDQ